MTTKTHHTAIVLIPPQEVWEPIQQIRRELDRQRRRWMPHVTLLYPFRPRRDFEELTPALSQACASFEPFDLTLETFHHFRHGRSGATLWLCPEPRDLVVQLQAALWRTVPDCDDTNLHPGGFNPHLSVGQVIGSRRLRRVLQRLQTRWTPLTFPVRSIHLIAREDPPNDVFEVVTTIDLG